MNINKDFYVLSILGLVMMAIISFALIDIYEHKAIKDKILSTQNYTLNVDGEAYIFEGTGESAQEAGQEVHDAFNTMRVIVGVLLTIIFMWILIAEGATRFFTKLK